MGGAVKEGRIGRGGEICRGKNDGGMRRLVLFYFQGLVEK
jgi:hypothetical protein